MSLPSPVLYAEDDSDDVFFLRHAWNHAGIANQLINVPDGQQTIDYLSGQGPFADREKHPLPCLLLLDLNMPGKNGFDVLRWIRQQPDLDSLKIVILSGSNQERDINFAQRLGIIDYIVKPNDLRELTALIQKKKNTWLPTESMTAK